MASDTLTHKFSTLLLILVFEYATVLRKSMRTPENKDFEEAVLKWFFKQRIGNLLLELIYYFNYL